MLDGNCVCAHCSALCESADAVYGTYSNGLVWRVHDADITGGWPHRVPLGDPRVNTRYLVNATGERRAYTFGNDHRRILTPDMLLEH